MARPGSYVSIAAGRKRLGSLGAFIRLEDGIVGAVTAGHVVQKAAGAPLIANTADTQLALGTPIVNRLGAEMLVVDARADLAVIGPINVDLDALSGPEVFIRNPTTADVSTRLWVYAGPTFLPLSAFVMDVGVRARFFRADGPGELWVEGLTAIDAVTVPGDSGAPVMDEVDNLVGFVTGGDGLHSYLTPAKRGLDVLETRRH